MLGPILGWEYTLIYNIVCNRGLGVLLRSVQTKPTSCNIAAPTMLDENFRQV